ncbi:hypothetical protein CYMTET_40450 [Cymbomonas tetramitiformis]|uniref:Uncharacterized protein n=1 Tax=Cymbomonas tetramitiformis TaxID=36881 RepID=A0AAE0C935_9CHLO|nr:hypothetical protein CYMTET_40450 [Cymbomonas tetramitiformis]
MRCAGEMQMRMQCASEMPMRCAGEMQITCAGDNKGECLVDGGKEFEELCRDCLIDRGVTSPDSPEGIGLVERVVKTINFKKIALEKGLDYKWDELLCLDFEQEIEDEEDARVKDLVQRARTVKRLMRDGVVLLEDNTGLKKSTVQSIAPCRLQVNDQYDFSAARPSKNLAYEVLGARVGCRISRGEPSMRGLAVASVKAKPRLVDRLAEAAALRLKEKLGVDIRLLPADVGPYRITRGWREQPWQALTTAHIEKAEGDLDNLPDRIDWDNQEVLTDKIQELMPGLWHEGHRTILSRKCAEQQVKARELRHSHRVPAMTKEEVQKRGEVARMSRAHVKSASTLQWGLELVITVPHEVKHLAMEVNWKTVSRVWDPWAGTGVISEVMKEQWEHLEFMCNDWNPQLNWPEARNALQPGNYRAWKERYGVCDAVITSPWFAVLDIALPLAVMASRMVACIHVPSHYMTDMTGSRARYFRKLCHARRLHVVGHLEQGPIGRRCMWVLVFKNPLLRARMLHGGEL